LLLPKLLRVSKQCGREPLTLGSQQHRRGVKQVIPVHHWTLS
jgi:hypothetical protein